MTERFSFTDLFEKPIDIEKGKSVILDGIVIPKIQRPYAQGRTDEQSTFVRNTFLEEIFSVLQSGTIMDLNFVYGIIRPGEKGHVMELLDGQQRLTTLFLLYWYVANLELAKDSEQDNAIRSSLRRFSYETRATSSYFCHKLADFHVDIAERKPKSVITAAKWYFKSFDRDSTICAMLTMLDSIHDKYEELGCENLAVNLGNLRFYVKSLGYYNLSEELYIKMNARGLQLSAFENYKADLTNFVTKCSYPEFSKEVPLYRNGSTDKVPFSQNFSIKLDAKWVDLFWKKGSEDFDSSYMSFFSRFFSYKYILDTADTITDREMRQDPGIKALYTDAEARIARNEYFGFRSFNELLEKHPEYIVTLDKVLDILHDYDYRDGKRLLCREFVPAWDRDEGLGVQVDDFLYNFKTRFTHQKLILLSAVMEFIEVYDTFNLDVFKHWMRVVNNIIENTNIDSLTPVSSLVRKFSAVIRFVAQEENNTSFMSFYRGLSKWTGPENENRALLEEVEKARRISEDFNWFDSFQKAEKHEYFKGMVLFFYDKDMSLAQYEEGREIISGMFDKNGIASEYRDKHILLRAIVSCFRSWGELNERYITERSEPNKYLKNTLASHDGVRAMFAKLALSGKGADHFAFLQDVIDNAGEVFQWDSATAEQRAAFDMAVDNLRHNLALYDYFTKIDEEQKNGKNCFRIYLFEGLFMLAVYGRQYLRIALDTDRAIISKKIADQHKFNFDDKDILQFIEAHGSFCYGKEIWLRKDIGDVIFWIGFCTDHEVRVQLQFSSPEEASSWLERFPGSAPLDGEYKHYLGLPSLRDYPNVPTYEQLVSVIETVESTLNTTPAEL